MTATLDATEPLRRATLAEYDVFGSPPEAAFDRLTRMAAQVFDRPIALVTLIGATEQTLKSRHGTDLARTPRAHAFCDHTIRQADVLEICDATADPRTADNPLVTGAPHLRYYVGAPLVAPNGMKLGAFCLLDQQPHPALSEAGRRLLVDFAALAMHEIETRAAARRALALVENLRRA